MADKNVWKQFLTKEELEVLDKEPFRSPKSTELFQEGWKRYKQWKKDETFNRKLKLTSNSTPENIVTMDNFRKSKIVQKMFGKQEVTVKAEPTKWEDFLSEDERDVLEAFGKYSSEYQRIKTKCQNRLYKFKAKQKKLVSA